MNVNFITLQGGAKVVDDSKLAYVMVLAAGLINHYALLAKPGLASRYRGIT
jgi:hypothetical protein